MRSNSCHVPERQRIGTRSCAYSLFPVRQMSWVPHSWMSRRDPQIQQGWPNTLWSRRSDTYGYLKKNIGNLSLGTKYSPPLNPVWSSWVPQMATTSSSYHHFWWFVVERNPQIASLSGRLLWSYHTLLLVGVITAFSQNKLKTGNVPCLDFTATHQAGWNLFI